MAGAGALGFFEFEGDSGFDAAGWGQRALSFALRRLATIAISRFMNAQMMRDVRAPKLGRRRNGKARMPKAAPVVLAT